MENLRLRRPADIGDWLIDGTGASRIMWREPASPPQRLLNPADVLYSYPEQMTNAPIPMTAPLRILGLDPGLRRTGWGVIAVEGSRLTHVAHGVIAPKDSLPFAERLLCLFDAISED